jgi:hypothetical protein
MKKSIINNAHSGTQFLIILYFVLCIACSRTYNVVTKVLPDGCSYREYLINSDSTLLKGDTSKNKIPVILNSSYKVTLYNNTPSGKKLIPCKWPLKTLNHSIFNSANITLTVHRDFTSAKELESSSYFNNTSWRQIKHTIIIDKKFRWFYTEHLYNETYPAYNPFRKIPVSKYLSDEEIAIYTGVKSSGYAKKDSIEQEKEMKMIENKVMDWLAHSIYEEFFAITISNLHIININRSDSIKLIASKNNIYNLLNNTEDISPAHYIDICCSYLKNDNYRKLLIPNSKSADDFKIYDKILDIFSDNFHFSLLLPGKIVFTNADKINCDTMLWKLTAYKYFFHDYSVVARSRVTNFLMWWLTGGMIVCIIGLLLKKALGRRQVGT